MAKKPAKPKPEAGRSVADQVCVVPIAILTPDSKNAMDHPDRNAAVVKSSLERFGPGRSIVLDGLDNVVAGNCTVESAKVVGFHEVIVVEPKAGQLVAVKRSDWSPEEARQYGLVDNRSSELAEWNKPILLEHLDDIGVELAESLGWNEIEVGELRVEVSGLDDTPEPDDQPKTATTYECPACGHQWSPPKK